MNEFNYKMDEICSELFIGEHYHERCANEFRKIGLRGFGRWCDCESKGDYCSRVALEKLLCDRLDYSPRINTAGIDKALTVQIGDLSALKSTLESWYNREADFITILNKAVELSRSVDISIYGALCELLEEVQTEKTRVKMLNKRLELKGYDGHDVGQVSKELHKYFEANPDDKTLDYNVG
ncbi:MAG: hypothetical protein FWH07_04940 [Oscillospiraceae bacterium]|nr:hypothetical protein [Oscillospiraceae bacterium]